MRIVCFIDSLGSGGAQRQLVNLAIGLKEEGHNVHFLVYRPDDFYLSRLKENDIKVTFIENRSYVSRLWKCCKYIRSKKFDAVIAFLETPALIAELASFPCHSWKLIVGERSAHSRIVRTFKGRFLRLFHGLADFIVANSYTNIDLVIRANPFLSRRKLKVIYNTYNLNELNPEKFMHLKREDGRFHILVAATHSFNKNFTNLAKAIASLSNQYKDKLVIDWYGRQESICYQQNLQLVQSLNISNNVNFYPPIVDIYQKMIDADAVGLFSFVEGLSNTICEALCLGKPVIVSDVSDNRKLVDNSDLMCDPASPTSIATALMHLLSLSEENLYALGLKNRVRAELLFKQDYIIHAYLMLIKDNTKKGNDTYK